MEAMLFDNFDASELASQNRYLDYNAEYYTAVNSDPSNCDPLGSIEALERAEQQLLAAKRKVTRNSSSSKRSKSGANGDGGGRGGGRGGGGAGGGGNEAPVDPVNDPDFQTSALGRNESEADRLLATSLPRKLEKQNGKLRKEMLGHLKPNTPEYVSAMRRYQSIVVPATNEALRDPKNAHLLPMAVVQGMAALDDPTRQHFFDMPKRYDLDSVGDMIAQFHDRMAVMYNFKHYGVFAKLVDLVAKSAMKWDEKQRPALLLAGKKSTGKSYIMEAFEEQWFPGVYDASTHRTDLSMTTGGNRDLMIVAVDEAPPNLVGGGAGSMAKEVEQSRGNAILKSSFTRKVITTVRTAMVNGRYVTEKYVMSVIGTHIVATNLQLSSSDNPMLARYIVQFVNGIPSDDAESIEKRICALRDPKSSELKATLLSNCQLINFYIMYTELLIKCCCIADVNMDAFALWEQLYVRNMDMCGYALSDPKRVVHVREVTRTLAVEHAVCRALFSELTHKKRFNSETSKFVRFFDVPDQTFFPRMIERFLFVNYEMSVFVFSLCSSLWMSQLAGHGIDAARSVILSKYPEAFKDFVNRLPGDRSSSAPLTAASIAASAGSEECDLAQIDDYIKPKRQRSTAAAAAVNGNTAESAENLVDRMQRMSLRRENGESYEEDLPVNNMGSDDEGSDDDTIMHIDDLLPGFGKGGDDGEDENAELDEETLNRNTDLLMNTDLSRFEKRPTSTTMDEIERNDRRLKDLETVGTALRKPREAFTEVTDKVKKANEAYLEECKRSASEINTYEAKRDAASMAELAYREQQLAAAERQRQRLARTGQVPPPPPTTTQSTPLTGRAAGAAAAAAAAAANASFATTGHLSDAAVPRAIDKSALVPPFLAYYENGAVMPRYDADWVEVKGDAMDEESVAKALSQARLPDGTSPSSNNMCSAIRDMLVMEIQAPSYEFVCDPERRIFQLRRLEKKHTTTIMMMRHNEPILDPCHDQSVTGRRYYIATHVLLQRLSLTSAVITSVKNMGFDTFLSRRVLVNIPMRMAMLENERPRVLHGVYHTLRVDSRPEPYVYSNRRCVLTERVMHVVGATSREDTAAGRIFEPSTASCVSSFYVQYDPDLLAFQTHMSNIGEPEDEEPVSAPLSSERIIFAIRRASPDLRDMPIQRYPHALIKERREQHVAALASRAIVPSNRLKLFTALNDAVSVRRPMVREDVLLHLYAQSMSSLRAFFVTKSSDSSLARSNPRAALQLCLQRFTDPAEMERRLRCAIGDAAMEYLMMPDEWLAVRPDIAQIRADAARRHASRYRSGDNQSRILFERNLVFPKLGTEQSRKHRLRRRREEESASGNGTEVFDLDNLPQKSSIAAASANDDDRTELSEMMAEVDETMARSSMPPPPPVALFASAGTNDDDEASVSSASTSSVFSRGDMPGQFSRSIRSSLPAHVTKMQRRFTSVSKSDLSWLTSASRGEDDMVAPVANASSSTNTASAAISSSSQSNNLREANARTTATATAEVAAATTERMPPPPPVLPPSIQARRQPFTPSTPVRTGVGALAVEQARNKSKTGSQRKINDDLYYRLQTLLTEDSASETFSGMVSNDI